MLKKRKISILSLALIIGMLGVGCGSTDQTSNKPSTEVTTAEVLQNNNFKKALNLALDKQGLIDAALPGSATAVNTLVPNGLAKTQLGEDYTELTKSIGYELNPSAAKEAWEAAKKELGIKEATIDFLTFDTPKAGVTSNFIKEDLESKLPGLTVNIVAKPFEDKLKMEDNGEFDIALVGWVPDFPDPSTFLDTFAKDGYYSNGTKYVNEEYSNLVKEGKLATDTNSSWEKYVEAEKILLEDGVVIPLYNNTTVYATKDYLKNVARYSYGPPVSYKWAELTNGKKEITTAMESLSLVSLDTALANDTSTFEYISDCFEGLVRIDGDGTVKPGIAKEWKMSEDGMTWTFNLRDDAKWTNGENVTANDFVYSWERILNPETKSAYAFIMAEIEGADDYNKGDITDFSKVGVKAIDDYTLEIKLTKPVMYFDQLMSFATFLPVNKTAVEKHGDKYGTSPETVVYNGPFVLETMSSEKIVRVKNNSYWDKDSVKVDKVTVISEPQTESIKKYNDGVYDVLSMSGDTVKEVKNQAEVKTRQEASAYMLIVNQSSAEERKATEKTE